MLRHLGDIGEESCILDQSQLALVLERRWGQLIGVQSDSGTSRPNHAIAQLAVDHQRHSWNVFWLAIFWVGQTWLCTWVTSETPFEFRDTKTSTSRAEKSELHSSRWVCYTNSFLISCVLPTWCVQWPLAVHACWCRFVFAALMAWTIWFFWRAWKFPVFCCSSVFIGGRTHQ